MLQMEIKDFNLQIIMIVYLGNPETTQNLFQVVSVLVSVNIR